jgi:ribonucleoside-triphosphate reductase
MQFPIQQKFKLTEDFIDQYKSKTPPFGFNGLGEFVYMRTYSRTLESGRNEAWWETVRRVVEGIYSIQKQHIEDFRLGWSNLKAQRSAQKMYERIYNFKMLPAGRSLWSMGTPVIMEKGLTESLYNCSYLSTENIQEELGRIFANAMDFLMCGVGVGADVLGANKITIKCPTNSHLFQIPDSREGWVESLELLINAYFTGKSKPEFDYSLVRPAGEPIKTFGGVASGPQPLIELHKSIENILENRIGNKLTARDITDIFNLIGKAVIAGNVRRSAEIILGDPDEEFLDLKNYTKNPERKEFGWASNNSVYGEVGMNYSGIAERIRDNAEPGIFWLSNARKYGRMKETEANFKDNRASGLNP